MKRSAAAVAVAAVASQDAATASAANQAFFKNCVSSVPSPATICAVAASANSTSAPASPSNANAGTNNSSSVTSSSPSQSPSPPPSPTPAPSTSAASAASATVNGGLLEQTVQQKVSQYLQRRHYVRNGLGATSLKSAAVRHMVTVETSTNDAIQFSSYSLDPAAVDQQYSKFKLWISESADWLKPELAQLLYPVFTHLYLELVSAGHKAAATRFHKRHQSTFLGNAELAAFIRQLAPVSTPEEVDAAAGVVADFRACKYAVTVSDATWAYLSKYLQGCAQPIIVHVLRSKVDLKMSTDSLGACSKSESLRRALLDRADDQVSSNNEALTNGDDDDDSVDIDNLNRIIAAVRDGPSPLPNACLYRLSGAGDDASQITSSTIRKDGAAMATASVDSAVCVWKLAPPSERVGVSVPPNRRQPRAKWRPGASPLLLGCDRISRSSGPRPPRLATVKKETPEEEEVIEEDSSSEEELDSDPEQEEKDCVRLVGHSGPVYGVAFVPGYPNHLLSCGEDTSLRLWDVTAASHSSNVVVYQGHSYPVWCLGVDNIGLNVVTGSMDRTARLWHLEHTFPVRVFSGHEQDVDAVAMHPNCNYVATASVDRTVRLWSHSDAKMVRVLSGHRGVAHALSFSPDGKLLCAAGTDTLVRVWDVASAKSVAQLSGHSLSVHAVAWSPDSGALAAAGADGTVRIWDARGAFPSSDTPMAAFHTGCSVTDLRYSNFNTLLVTAGALTGPATSSKTNPVPEVKTEVKAEAKTVLANGPASADVIASSDVTAANCNSNNHGSNSSCASD